MDGDQHLWQVWAEVIQRWGMEKWLAAFLESFGSLTVLVAQLIYFTGPLLPRNEIEKHLFAFARMLENPDHTRDFARLLREGAFL